MAKQKSKTGSLPYSVPVRRAIAQWLAKKSAKRMVNSWRIAKIAVFLAVIIVVGVFLQLRPDKGASIVAVASQSPGRSRPGLQTFASGEEPAFIIKTADLLSERQSKQASGSLETRDGRIGGQLIDTDGQTSAIEPVIASSAERADEFLVTIPAADELPPGKYRLEVTLMPNDTAPQTLSQDFTWGVLALNADKSTYLPNETARLGMAVLDDAGVTLCDAQIELKITAPGGKQDVLANGRGIDASAECRDKGVTNEPDYSAAPLLTEPGSYHLELTADTKNGRRRTEQIIEVTGDAPFVSRRYDTATRIYPAARYEVTAEIKANRGFRGTVLESVPAVFNVSGASLAVDGQAAAAPALYDKDAKTIIEWSGISLKAGQTANITYTYKAPMVSPELYRLGSLELVEGQKTVFGEPRPWQVAADAVNDVILLWDPANGAVPAGWTCISCASGDPFYQLFPRAAASYGGSTAGGPESGSHTYALSGTVGGPSATATVSNVLANTNVGSATHTHTFGGPTTGTADIKPPFKNLQLIRASNPSSLPQNVIGMFDVASAALPAGWTHYSALAGNYLRGENSNTTGGSSTHTHTRGAITSGAPSATTNVAGGTAGSSASHTHTIAAGNTPAANNDPPFAKLNFARLTSAAALPDGLIAFFDATALPVGWSVISGAGSVYENRLIKGDASPATTTTGGSATHNHGGSQSLTSGAPTAAAGGGVGITSVASAAHTHNVTYSISSENSWPAYRDAVLGKLKTITLSGTVYADEGTSALGSQPVKAVLAGAAARSVTAAADGTYSLSVPDPGNGGSIALWLDTNGGASGAVHTLSSGSNISGLDLYQNRLIVRHESAGPISNANLGLCDKNSGSACADSDLHFNETGGALTVDNDWRLYIWGGKTFAPGGALTLNSGAAAGAPGGDIKWAASTSALNIGTNSLSVGGDWLNVAGGSFTKSAGQTTTFTAAGSGFSIESGGRNFEKVTFNAAGGAWSFAPATAAVTIDGDFTISSGSVTAPSASLSVGGSWTNSGSFSHNLGNVAFTSSASGKTINPGSSAFNNLTFNGSGSWSPLTSNLLVAGDLMLTAGTFDTSAGSSDVTVNGNVSGSGGSINFTAVNTFTQRVSTAKNFGTASGALNWTFNNLTFSNSAGSPVTVTAQAGTGGITVGGLLRVGATGDAAVTTLHAGSSGRNWTLSGSGGDPLQLLASPAAGLTAGNSTFSYTGNNSAGNTNVQQADYSGLTFGGAAAESYVPEGPITVTGDLTINANATLIGTQNWTVNGSANGSGTLNFTGGTFLQRVAASRNLGTTGGSNSWTFNNLTLENSSTSDQTITIGAGSGSLIVNGATVIGKAADTNRSTLQAGTNNRQLDLNGDLTITGRGGLVAPNSAAFTLAGSYLNAGSLTAGSGTLTFDAAANGRTVDSGGTGSGKDFNRIVFNNASGGWTIQNNNLTATGDLSLTAISQLSVESGRTVEVRGSYAVCGNCPAATTWTGSTLYLNSSTAYMVGSKSQSAETYGTLSVGVNTDIRLWQSGAASISVDASGSLYSQDHAAADGSLNIYGDYHVTGTDHWSYATDFDGTVLGGSVRQVAVSIETGSGRGAVVDASGTLNIRGGGAGTNQFTGVGRIGGTGSYRLVNNGTASISEAKLNDAEFAGGTWAPFNTAVSSSSVSAGTLTVDWYLSIHAADRDAAGNNIDTAGADITISEAGAAATIFKHNGSGWGSAAASQTADSGADGHIPQPQSSGALRIREYSRTSAATTYYRYNLAIAAQAQYATYDYFRDHGGNYITSTANTAAGTVQAIGENWYRDTIGTENSHTAVANDAPVNGSWYAGPAKAIILLWDSGDGTVPAGWTCVSCVSGDPFYQRFPRAAASYGGTGGGPESDGHELTSPSATAGAAQEKLTLTTNVASAAHTHDWSYGAGRDTSLSDIKPPYKNLRLIRGPASGSWPANIIAPFNRAATDSPINWTDYSANIGTRYLRGENDNLTGGAATHTHTNNVLTSAANSGSVGMSTVLAGAPTVASNGHTHSLPGGTALAAANNDPPFVSVVFMKLITGSAAPDKVLGFYDHASLPANWSQVSNAAPYQNNLIKAAATPGSSGGSATHNHGGSLGPITSGGPSTSQNGAAGTGANATAGNHTHGVSYAVSAESTLPLYRDVVIAEYSALSNVAPNSPASPKQFRVAAATELSTGGWTNETQVKFEASLSDTDNPDTLSLCVEVQPLATAFTDSETACGSGAAFSGSAVTDSVTISGLADASEFHWQARVKDAAGAYSAWVSYGGNAESARDFGTDSTAPATAAVYDNTNLEAQPSTADSEENGDGALDTLSATWAAFNGNVSGIMIYEYSIGTAAGDTDVKNWTDNGTGRTVRTGGLSIQTNQTYYVNVRATDNAGNVSPVASSNGQYVTPTLTFDIDIGGSTDPGPTNPPHSIDFGTLLTDAVSPSPQRIWLSISSNAASGARVYARGDSGGLRSSLTSHTIPSSSTDLASAGSGYGAQVLSATQSSGSLSGASPYDGAGDNVGILDASLRLLLLSSSPLTGGRASFGVKAKITNLTPAANDYRDVITVIATAAY